MFLDDFVRVFAPDSLFDGVHHYCCRQQERHIFAAFRGDNCRVYRHLVEDCDESFEQPVDCEERVGQNYAAHDRARYVALVPLVARQGCRHFEVSAQDYVEAVDALAAARVHFMRHCRRARLTLCEAFARQFRARHNAERFCERRRARAELVEARYAFVVKRAGVYLTRRADYAVYSQMFAHHFVELEGFRRVAVEERELVELRADRALEPADGVGCDECVEVFDCPQGVFSVFGKALADCRELRDYVVRTRCQNRSLVLARRL